MEIYNTVTTRPETTSLKLKIIGSYFDNLLIVSIIFKAKRTNICWFMWGFAAFLYLL